jgi:hypothetical protein
MMATQAKGEFTVKMTPQPWSDTVTDHSLGRFLLEKEFHGDLEGVSQGQMLTAGTVEKGSAGYVAIEKVTGKLQGRAGTFALQHNATMNRGVPTLSIQVVPDSGTNELAGLGGEMKIVIADGKHSYEFSYSLATLQ